MSITSDEVNFLVYRYLQESGFVHSAFTFAYESQVAKSSVVTADIPPGVLISFLQKGLQYISIETHINEDGTERECNSEVSLVNPHTCRLAQTGIRDLGKGAKRKRKTFDSNSAVSDDKRESSDAPATAKPNGEKLPSTDVSFLTGHQAEVFICAWNPKSNILASGSGDSTARLWNIPSDYFSCETKPSPTATVLTHNNENGVNKDVTTIEWNGNGTLLATGSYDGQGRIWDQKGTFQRSLNCHQGPIFSLKWNKESNLLLSGSYDKTAIIWDPETGNVKQQFEVHTAPTLDVDWKDNTTFASCSTDKTIQICSLGESKPVRTFRGHEDEVNTIKWNPSGSILASCSDDHTAKIWNPEKESFVHNFTQHSKEIYTIQWSPTGPGTDNPNKNLLLASASFDSTIKIWDVEAGKCLHTLQHSDPVYSVAFSPNGDYIASGALNGALHIWSTTEGKVVKSYYGSGDIFEVDWNHRGDLVAACFSNNNLCVVNFRS